MDAQQMWRECRKIYPALGEHANAWSFGVEADHLADLVLRGEKTATSSAYDLYAVDQEALPQAGSFHLILDSRGQAVCIIEIRKVSILPFCQVPAEHAYKEGEGDKSLDYWRRTHREVFSQWLNEAGLAFSEESKIVLEEFCRIYPLEHR
mgnify:CR=1 FL=1